MGEEVKPKEEEIREEISAENKVMEKSDAPVVVKPKEESNKEQVNTKKAWYIRVWNWFKEIIEEFVKKINDIIEWKAVKSEIRLLKEYDKALNLEGKSPDEIKEIKENYIKMLEGFEKVCDLSHNSKYGKELFGQMIKNLSPNDSLDNTKKEYKIYKEFLPMANAVYEIIINFEKLRPYLKDKQFSDLLEVGEEISKDDDVKQAILVAVILEHDLGRFVELMNTVEDINFNLHGASFTEFLIKFKMYDFVEVLMEKNKIDYSKEITEGEGESKTIDQLIYEEAPKLIQKQIVQAYREKNLDKFKKLVKITDDPDFYVTAEIVGEETNRLFGNKTLSTIIMDNDGHKAYSKYLEVLLLTDKMNLEKKAYTDENTTTVKERFKRYLSNPTENKKEIDELKNLLAKRTIEKEDQDPPIDDRGRGAGEMYK